MASAAAAAAWAACSAQGQVVNYDLFFFAEYDQVAAGSVVGPSQFAASARVIATNPDDLESAILVRPGILPPVTLDRQDDLNWSFFQFFAGLASMDTQYPAGTYRVRINGGTLGLLEGPLVRPSQFLFCPEVPEFTGDTFTRMQSVDASSEFVFQISSFTPDPGTNLAGTFLIVTNAGGGPELFSAFVDPSVTEVAMPGGTLAPGTAYTAAIFHSSRVSTAGGGLGGATAVVGFDRVTRAALFTSAGGSCPGQGPGACSPGDWNEDGAIDFNDLLAFLNTFNAADPCADLNADGAVDFNDLLEFLNLYNVGC
jgi:hypothetical protein